MRAEHTETSTSSRSGIAIAAVTAVISGCAIFANGFGVRAWSGTADATAYTTIKNVVAALALVLVAVGVRKWGSSDDAPARPRGRRQITALILIAAVGGSVPFVLFFEGLASATSGQAALIHKTLVVWVALLAPLFLRERFRPVHAIAITLLVVGQLFLVDGGGAVAFGRGEILILIATLLWSAEVILAKRVLGEVPSMTVGIARMAGGAVVLLVWHVVRGGDVAFGAATASQWAWILASGLMLAAYVGTWYAALKRAGAIDVTAVLVGGVFVTAMLRGDLVPVAIPSTAGLVLVACGAMLAFWGGAQKAVS